MLTSSDEYGIEQIIAQRLFPEYDKRLLEAAFYIASVLKTAKGDIGVIVQDYLVG